MGDRVRCGATYRLSALFPDASPEELALFVEGLRHPGGNFEVMTLSEVRPRSVADLLAASPLPAEAREVCLEYLAPLSFEPQQPARPWWIGAPQFGEFLMDRLARLFGAVTAPAADAWRDLMAIPYFWQKEAIAARSSRSAGQWGVVGNVGPLYLRGPLAPVWPWLLLAEEFPLGEPRIGGGALRLDFHQPVFAATLRNPQTYLKAFDDLAERTDLQEEFTHALRDPLAIARELASAASGGDWQPEPAGCFRVRKEGGDGERLVTVLPPRDYLLHKALQMALALTFDRAFEPASVGYRPGVDPESVRRRLRSAYRAGRVWALKADIEQFFDQIDWTILEERLQTTLPLADAPLVRLLVTLMRTPLVLNGEPLARTAGLPQGSPLSPLLSNVYLDGFDEEMERRGLCHVRFADDLLVLCTSETEAREAQTVLAELLAPLRLRLNPAKTAIVSVDAGFQFLGQTFGGGLDPAAVAEAGARRTLYVRDRRAWVGADHDALVVRAGGELLARVPFRRLDGVVLLGAGGASARVVERLDDWGLPLVFCSGSGRPLNTLAPRGREHFAVAAEHADRHGALGEAGRVGVARRIVRAKLQNYRAWLAELPGEPARATEAVIARSLAALPAARDVEALRGHEGIAARAVFRFLNDRAGQGWASAGREPHARADAWNSLLDFASHLLFSRLLVFVLQQGLDPWRGFLHSPQARFESLVCDLQEPFRARIERFIQKTVNRRVVQPADFVTHPKGGVRLSAEATARFLEQWERELLTRYSGDPAHLLDLMEAQVLTVRAWARHGADLGFYQMKVRWRDAAPRSGAPPVEDGWAETPPNSKP